MRYTKLVFIAIAVIAMSFISSTTLNVEERNYASSLLQETRDNLIKKISGLTTKQLTFKPDTASWSIAECVEHIAKSESHLFELAQNTLKEPADPSKRGEVKVKDEAIVGIIADRSDKRKAQEILIPTGTFGSFEATVEEFKSKRENSINYIKTTTDDLRNHYQDFPFGKLDTYQVILVMAGHTKRHTNQIDEIMKNSKFPKKGK